MKGIFLIVISVVLVALCSICAANAQNPPTVAIWTDKAEYTPGETGTLYVAFYNDYGSTVAIRKITIIFDNWRAYRNSQWEGNYTIELNPTLSLPSKQIYETNVKFTVPTDGRARNTNVTARIQTAEFGETPPVSQSINVVQPPKYMTDIVMLLNLHIVLMIVGVAVISGTVFLASRRPQLQRKPGEKE